MPNLQRSLSFCNPQPDQHLFMQQSRSILSRWEKAKEDLTAAKNMDMDIAATFQRQHESIADFERRYGLALPKDIAEMLA